MVRPQPLSPPQKLIRACERFLSLSRGERSLLLRAGLLVAAVRLGLWLFPFRRLECALTTLNHRLPATRRPRTVEDLAWAVKLSSSVIPQATCLTQALAAQWLLNRQSYATQLHLGFAKRGGKPVAGHAWLECQGRIVTGDGPLTSFTKLTTLHR